MVSVKSSLLAATAPSDVVPSRDTQAVSTTLRNGSRSVPSSAGVAMRTISRRSSWSSWSISRRSSRSSSRSAAVPCSGCIARLLRPLRCLAVAWLLRV